MKITLITACYNASATIRTAVASVLAQRRETVEVEYLVMDGGSADGTPEAVRELTAGEFPRLSVRCLSERDRGMYDALNKGVALATGDVVGILNADDVLADDDALERVAAAFSPPGTDAVYSDIRFVRPAPGASPDLAGLRTMPSVRYCTARYFRPWMFRFAAMVPHPGFYCRRGLFARYGGYSLDYRIAADFELLLRFMWRHRIRTRYLPGCLVAMRAGGVSTAGWRSNVEINREDLRALRANGCWSCTPLVYAKYLFKVWGFLSRRR